MERPSDGLEPLTCEGNTFGVKTTGACSDWFAPKFVVQGAVGDASQEVELDARFVLCGVSHEAELLLRRLSGLLQARPKTDTSFVIFFVRGGGVVVAGVAVGAAVRTTVLVPDAAVLCAAVCLVLTVDSRGFLGIVHAADEEIVVVWPVGENAVQGDLWHTSLVPFNVTEVLDAVLVFRDQYLVAVFLLCRQVAFMDGPCMDHHSLGCFGNHASIFLAEDKVWGRRL